MTLHVAGVKDSRAYDAYQARKNKVHLIQDKDGNTMDGILFPRDLAENSTYHYIDISSFGDWRKYMAHKNKL